MELLLDSREFRVHFGTEASPECQFVNPYQAILTILFRVWQVSFVWPHEAPDFGSQSHVRSSLPRILSAPCIMAVERMHCSQTVQPASMTSSQQQPPAQYGGTCWDHAAGAVSDDSGASEATGDTAALQDGAGSSLASGSFSAAFPLKG